MDTAYDRVPYPTATYTQTHVRRLAAIGRLFGVNAPDIRTCRVLEIGCGEGANLVNMAVDLPESQFVGIDISQTAIARATDLAKRAGVENITFRHTDVAELVGRPGECDYVIAHGVFSWIPREVQEKMLELCERVLAPTGIAYISYNTYPGWHVREMMAEMMRFHTIGTDDPETAVNEGLGLVQAVGRALGEESPYSKAILSEMERIVRRNKVVTFHDDLSPDMKPLLFNDFIQRARSHGLQFLAEADYTTMIYEDLPLEARSALEEIHDDAVRREQYLDFFKLRRLRETLLCRSDLTVLPEASTGAFDVLYFGVPLLPKTPPDYTDESPVDFVGQRNMSVTVAQPFVKAAIAVLCDAWPVRLKYAEVLERAQQKLLQPDAGAIDMLSELLMKMYGAGLLEIDTHPWPYPSKPSERPAVSMLARYQAKEGARVTSLRHQAVDLDDDTARRLIVFLDGTRDLDALSLATGMDRQTTEEYLKKLLSLSLLVS
ncbi:MAG TPA: class I SAM-dependent methyltransferase [Bryobacteraceae bacterium]|nr:class I SAM-dependent methyltransferase [Bryobacteraceae bacterium]